MNKTLCIDMFDKALLVGEICDVVTIGGRGLDSFEDYCRIINVLISSVADKFNMDYWEFMDNLELIDCEFTLEDKFYIKKLLLFEIRHNKDIIALYTGSNKRYHKKEVEEAKHCISAYSKLLKYVLDS